MARVQDILAAFARVYQTGVEERHIGGSIEAEFFVEWRNLQ